MEETSAIQRAGKALGGASGLAELTGVSVQAAYQWLNGERPVPAKHAPLIAAKSGVPVADLCPGVPWHLVEPPNDPPVPQAAA